MKPRLLKVELSSPGERYDLLSAAKKQKEADVRASKWLPRDEFTKLKQLRLHCDELNGKAAAMPDGKKSYVAFNGHLMARAPDGILSHMQSPVVKGIPQGKACSTARLQAECVSSSRPMQPGNLSSKNDSDGSYVAP